MLLSNKTFAGGSLIVAAILWFFGGLFEELFFGWIGDGIRNVPDESNIGWLLDISIQYVPSIIFLGIGLYLWFTDTKNVVPDMSIRDAYKYLMLDSKWSLGQRVNPYDNAASSQSDGAQLHSKIADELKKAAYTGKLKIWVHHDTELEARSWEKMIIDITTCMGRGDSVLVHDYKTKPITTYSNAMVNRYQLHSLWPKSNWLEKYKDEDLYNLRKTFYEKEYYRGDDSNR